MIKDQSLLRLSLTPMSEFEKKKNFFRDSWLTQHNKNEINCEHCLKSDPSKRLPTETKAKMRNEKLRNSFFKNTSSFFKQKELDLDLQLQSSIENLGEIAKNNSLFLKKDSLIKKNINEVKKMTVKNREKFKNKEKKPFYTISVMSKVSNEYFFNNLKLNEIVDENVTDLKALKVNRTKKQIKNVFGIKTLSAKERKLLFKQMVFEFEPERGNFEREYCWEISEFLKKNQENFLMENLP